jgi:hypothetical protein
VPDLAQPVGLGLLAVAAAVVVGAVAATVLQAVRTRRRALALRATIDAARQEGRTALALLADQRAEMEALIAPWRRVVRWARHPLVVATIDWNRRRRRQKRRRH